MTPLQRSDPDNFEKGGWKPVSGVGFRRGLFSRQRVESSSGDDLGVGQLTDRRCRYRRRYCRSGVRLEFAKEFGEVRGVLVDPQHLAARTVDDRHAAVPEAPLAGTAGRRRRLVHSGG